jgi:hypothetical protein
MKKILLLALIFVSCKAQEEISSEEEEKTYILIDGKHIELVADEFGNQYLKQYTYGPRAMYIPFTFETESAEDSIHSFQAKIPTNDERRF